MELIQVKDLQKALPHMLTALAVIVALVILAVDHVIAGGEAYGGILMAGGFTLGGTVASGSISTAATAAVDVSHSASTSNQTRLLTPSVNSPATAPTVQTPATVTTPTQPTSTFLNG